MRPRTLDLATALLLGLALVQAVALALRPPSGDVRAWIPLLGRDDPAGDLGAPGGAERAVRARTAALGDYLTVEDLARGVIALQDGSLPGAPPLSAAEREQVSALLRRADEHRAELLRVEAEIAEAEAHLAALAARMAAGLTPEQRAWVERRRDAVSVGQVERAYWDQARRAVGDGR